MFDEIEWGNGNAERGRGVDEIKGRRWSWLQSFRAVRVQDRRWTQQEQKGYLTFPGASTAPPMTTTSFTLRNVSGSCAAAIARFVSGPTATIVIVSGSFSLSKSSMTSCAGLSDGVKRQCSSLTFCSSAASSGERSSGVGLNSVFQVSAGERCGC